jgi:hypothetical protein
MVHESSLVLTHLINKNVGPTLAHCIRNYHSLCRSLLGRYAGGRWSSGKYVGTTCLRVAGSSLAPPAVWVFWRLIWRTESLDRGLTLVCRFSFVSSRECIAVAAQTHSCLQGWMCVRNPLLSERLSQRRATCAGGMIIVS